MIASAMYRRAAGLGVRNEHVLAESIGHDTCEPSPRSCITVAAKSSSSSYSASFKQPSSDGVDASLELVGSNTLRDTLRATQVHGVTYFTGMLSNQWTIPDFYPIDFIPNGVRLTAYGAPESDLPADVLESFLDQVAGGRLIVPIDHVYGLDEIRTAHADMEAGSATGKLVVLLQH